MKATILVRQGYPKLKEAIELDRSQPGLAAGHRRGQTTQVRSCCCRSLPGPQPPVARTGGKPGETGVAEPDPEDRFPLARLYLARGNWDRCREQMEKLVNGSQPNPGYLADYVRMLLDQDQLGDAEPWLDRLEKHFPAGQHGRASAPN